MFWLRTTLILLVLSFVAGTSLLLASQPQRASDSNVIDEAPLPSDPAAKASREAKNRRYNRGGRDLTTMPPGYSSGLDADGELEPLFPTWSPVIAIVTVISVQPYLSQDHTNIYTEYAVKVETWLKRHQGKLPIIDDKLVVDREGGVLRQASGRVIRYTVSATDMARPLLVNERCLLFLNRYNGTDLTLGRGFLFDGGSVYVMGEYAASDQFVSPPFAPREFSHEKEFLKAVRLAIANPPSSLFYSAIGIPTKKN